MKHLPMQVNLLRFYGFCPMDSEIGVLYDVASRGSLNDVLHNGDVHFDVLLKNSIISDFTNVSG